MPRAHLSRLSKLTPDQAARLFAEHHIVGLRQRKNGEITLIKHAQWGWISPQGYYQLQKLHDFLPLIEKAVEGGYRLKWALANVSIGGIPIGGIGYGFALGRATTLLTLGVVDPIFSKADGSPDHETEAITWIASVFLPYGELLWIYLAVLYLKKYGGALGGQQEPNAFQPASFVGVFVGFFRWAIGAGLLPGAGVGSPVAGPVGTSPNSSARR